MTYRVKVELCTGGGTPLYWTWAEDAEIGSEISFTVPDIGSGRLGPWTPFPARPAGQVTRAEQEKLDPILGQAFRRFGAEAGDLIMAAYRLGRGDEL